MLSNIRLPAAYVDYLTVIALYQHIVTIPRANINMSTAIDYLTVIALYQHIVTMPGASTNMSTVIVLLQTLSVHP